MKKILKTLSFYALLLVTKFGMMFAYAEETTASGLNEGEFKAWVSAYLTPLQNILLWVIPIVLAIYLLVSAVKYFSKESEGEQQKPYWVQVKKGVIVGVIAESVTLLLKIFSISQ